MSCLWIAKYLVVNDPTHSHPRIATVDELLEEIRTEVWSGTQPHAMAPVIDSLINECQSHSCDYSIAIDAADHGAMVVNAWMAAFRLPGSPFWSSVEEELGHGGGTGDFSGAGEADSESDAVGTSDPCPFESLPIHVQRAISTIVLFVERHEIQSSWPRWCRCIEHLLEERETNGGTRLQIRDALGRRQPPP